MYIFHCLPISLHFQKKPKRTSLFSLHNNLHRCRKLEKKYNKKIIFNQVDREARNETKNFRKSIL
jgi:hypothetical protein